MSDVAILVTVSLLKETVKDGLVLLHKPLHKLGL